MGKMFAGAVLLVGLWGAGVSAQQQGGQSQTTPGQKMARQSQVVLQVVPVEGVIGYLAFEADLSDEKLVGARQALKGIYDKRQGLIQRVQGQGPDMSTLRQDVMELRSGMLSTLEPVLAEAQITKLRQLLGMAGQGAAPGAAAGP